MENLSKVMEGVNPKFLAYYFQIPKSSDVVTYLTDNSTWDNIAVALYHAEEEKALEQAEQYVLVDPSKCVASAE